LKINFWSSYERTSLKYFLKESSKENISWPNSSNPSENNKNWKKKKSGNKFFFYLNMFFKIMKMTKIQALTSPGCDNWKFIQFLEIDRCWCLRFLIYSLWLNALLEFKWKKLRKEIDISNMKKRFLSWMSFLCCKLAFFFFVRRNQKFILPINFGWK
jgi:hypothetical protein